MPSIDDNTLAQQYGFALAVLNSDPELKALFNRAVGETWTADRFQAGLRNTKWYRAKSESQRNAAILKDTDRASYVQQVSQLGSTITQLAGEMGANLGSQLGAIAERAFVFGWDQNQIREFLGRYVKFSGEGQLGGQAAQVEEELLARARQQGVNLGRPTVEAWVGAVMGGRVNIQSYFNSIDKHAEAAYPHLKDRLRAGETVEDIANPYRETYSALLEVDPGSVTVQDPLIKRALQAQTDKGFALKPLWEFEKDVRSDARWLKTKNAQDAAMSTTRRVLSDMGLVS